MARCPGSTEGDKVLGDLKMLTVVECGGVRGVERGDGTEGSEAQGGSLLH